MNFFGNLTRLRYFQAVCKYEGMTKAAEALCISQPSLTTAIKELEKELGLSLFTRTKNTLQITEEGKVVLEKVNEMIDSFDSCYEEILDMGVNALKSAVLGFTPVMGTLFIPKLISDFPAKYPEIDLTLRECISKESFSLLDTRALDLALVMSTDFSDNYNYKILYETELCFCVNEDCHLAGKKTIDISDIGDFPLMLLSTGSSHHQIVMDKFKDASVEPNVILESRELYTIIKLIREFGFATISYRDIFQKVSGITCIPFSIPLKVKVAVIWNKDNYTNTTIQKLVKYLSSVDWTG